MSCTLYNVYTEDACEDVTPNQKSREITCQSNREGGTVMAFPGPCIDDI